MKITKDNITKINFFGLALTFSTVAEPEKAGKLHDSSCSVVQKALKTNPAKATIHVMMDGGVIEDTLDLLDRQYGVSLCKCAKHAVDVK